MKVMVMVKLDAAREGSYEPTEDVFAAMGRYNEELVNAGIMLAGEGLRPSSDGVKIVFEGGNASVVHGPFTEAKEIVGGFWIWEVRSFDEAIEWAKRCPNDPSSGLPQILELRPVAEAEDFGDALTPELREQEERLAARLREQRQGG